MQPGKTGKTAPLCYGLPFGRRIGTPRPVTALHLWITWLLTVACAALLRNRIFAAFTGVLLGISVLVWSALFLGRDLAFMPVIYYLEAATVVHFLFLTRPRLRPAWYRALVSIPALWFLSGTLLAFPWAIAAAIGFEPMGWWIAWLLALLGVAQSLRNPAEEVDVVLDGRDAGPLGRVPTGRGEGPSLSLFQITDPHLGPFMSAERLRAVCEYAVSLEPELVLITGDLLTMESHADVDAVTYALEPLRELHGRVYACLGNHDHEARPTVFESLERIGGHLLVDEMVRVDTSIGPVEIVGADFVFRGRRHHLEDLFTKYPRTDATPRILLLHDPGAFRHVPDGAADLTLAGHTHGGHVGLLSLGVNWTTVGATSTIPDHGFWAKGRNRMYVHRGTGHYGFPIRLGVPGEESLMRAWWPQTATESE